jgi:hypothetical protein
MSVEDAAGMLEWEMAAVNECALRHTDRFGLLSGPPAVLFQLTNEMGD